MWSGCRVRFTVSGRSGFGGFGGSALVRVLQLAWIWRALVAGGGMLVGSVTVGVDSACFGGQRGGVGRRSCGWRGLD